MNITELRKIVKENKLTGRQFVTTFTNSKIPIEKIIANTPTNSKYYKYISLLVNTVSEALCCIDYNILPILSNLKNDQDRLAVAVYLIKNTNIQSILNFVTINQAIVEYREFSIKSGSWGGLNE